MEYENGVPNTNFPNPSKDDKLPRAKNLKCEMCALVQETKTCKNGHKKEKHNWCKLCYASFSSPKKLKNPMKKKHWGKSVTGLTF